ncbi:hypothetical protein DFH28DRAFT_110277 [Melampsora americana]|nr:hypothetical protein DFH28DRAFT_110277 [Melampsora americana]
MKSINSISSQKSKSNLLLSTILEPNCLSNTRISKQSNPNQLPKSIYITIQDSICQSALPIINQIIQSFTLQSSETTKLSNQKLLVIGLNYHPSIFKNHLNEHQFNRINLSSNDSKEINVNGLLELVEIELNPIQPESSITIIIDSLGECIRRWSIKDTLRLFTQLLKK